MAKKKNTSPFADLGINTVLPPDPKTAGAPLETQLPKADQMPRYEKPDTSPADVLAGIISSFLQPSQQIANNAITQLGQSGTSADPFASMLPAGYQQAITSTQPAVNTAMTNQMNA